MVQFSVYSRVCNGNDDVEKHKKRMKFNLHNNGSVRSLVITEKQYESIDILVGKISKEERDKIEQLTIF